MAKENFERALPLILAYEGGYSDHPSDPGGKTLQGVTKAVWDGYRRNNLLTAPDMSAALARWPDWPKHRDAIYRAQYWDAVQGDRLPAGIDLVVFDTAVNSGPGRAVKLLQQTVGAKVDGVLGQATLAAVDQAAARDVTAAVDGYCEARLTFLRALKTWSTFGKGWTARVQKVREAAMTWAAPWRKQTKSVKPPADAAETPRATDSAVKRAPSTAGADAALGAGGTAATIGAAIETARHALEPYAGASPFVQQIVVGLVLVGAVVAIGGLVWRGVALARAARIKAAAP